jgi:predicted kinase
LAASPLELVVLIGLQGAGKSTFRRQFFDATHVVVSKDLLRNNRRPQRRQLELIHEALRRGASVVVDNTNPRVEDRAALIDVARQYDARVRGFYLSCSVDISRSRNALRTGRERVADIGILTTAKLLRRPSRAEGFDDLYYVTPATAGEFLVEAFREDLDAG